ncbi:hypothetical protein Pst134EB_012285 [Puccinia striiformis f. sp. tritici]|nr:hypothetical protein Pst134EB_012285 [Puccinia striiformis f. sp. tritici]
MGRVDPAETQDPTGFGSGSGSLRPQKPSRPGQTRPLIGFGFGQPVLLSGRPALLESVVAGSHQARYSFVGNNPSKVLRTGKNYTYKGNPLIPLEKELKKYKYVPVPGILPFTGNPILHFRVLVMFLYQYKNQFLPKKIVNYPLVTSVKLGTKDLLPALSKISLKVISFKPFLVNDSKKKPDYIRSMDFMCVH